MSYLIGQQTANHSTYAYLKALSIRLPRLERDNTVLKITRRKALALLIYLAVTGKTQGRDTLATLFWPDSAQSQARTALSRHLSELNKILPEAMLLLEAETVSLRGDLWLDVAEFKAALTACSEATEASLPALRGAVALYNADFLADFTLPDCPDFDEWQFFQTESLRQQFAAALEKLVQIQQAQGDYEAAIAHARRWLALDPLNEPAQRALMACYAQAGQPAAALRQYQQCQQMLEAELGLAPAEETTALYERIRTGEYGRGAGEPGSRGEKAQSNISPPGPPEGGTGSDSPPSGGPGGPKLAAPRHNLPAQTTPFVGRERELAALTRLLTGPHTRLVTILGPGGMGKTRLARQTGRRLLERFADGVWFVSLTAVDADTFGPALNPLLNGLAGVFGWRLHGGNSPEEQVLAHLQGRQMLLIFDNLEHLLDSSEIISQLLSGAAGIRVLATSRERLNLQEEWLFPLDGLALPDPAAGQQQGAETEAIQLFTQAAQRVQPAFDLNPNWAAAAQICHLVEGMPLGIELAASWVRYLAPAEIAQEIERNIDFLATQVRNLPARHRSLRAVFDHSWRLLSAQEQAVLPQLAVFRGGFRPAEAQAVAGVSRLDLTTLVDKSLLSVSAEGRYDLHERLRQYLLDKLRQDISVYQATNERHSQVYLTLMQLDPVELAKQTTLQRISDDYDNVRAAWQWAMDHAQWSAIRHSQRGMGWFQSYKGWLLEANEFYEKTISTLKQHTKPNLPGSSELPGRSSTEAHLLLAAWQCYHVEKQVRLGIHNPARQTILHENLAILRALGPVAHPELAKASLGAIAPERRRTIDSHEAKWHYAQEGLALCQALGDAIGQSRALMGLGFDAVFAGQFETAETYAHQLLSLAEPAGDAYHTAGAFAILGDLAQARGDYAQAEGHYWTGYQHIFSISPSFPPLVFHCSDLANVARLQGDYAQAAAYLQQAEAVVHQVGHGHAADFRRHEVLLISGYLAETQGDLLTARQAFEEIWQQDQGQSHYSPAALTGLGRVAWQTEDWPSARQHFATALPLISQLQTAPQALDALAGVAHLQAQAGQLEQALTLISLVHHHPSSFQESKDRVAGLEADLRAALPPEQVQAALARGRDSELWATAAEVRAELET